MDFLNPPQCWDGQYQRLRMQISRLATQGQAVSLDEMLLDLRIDSGDEDQTVQRLIGGMTDYMEIRTGWRLAPASYEARIACGPQPFFIIPRGPIRSVEEVAVYNGETKTWDVQDPSTYSHDDMGTDFSVYLTNNNWPVSWPGAVGPGLFPYRVKFMAGFDAQEDNATGEIHTSVVGQAADGMIVALKGLVALGYQKREAGENNDADKDQILRGYRKYW